MSPETQKILVVAKKRLKKHISEFFKLIKKLSIIRRYVIRSGRCAYSRIQVWSQEELVPCYVLENLSEVSNESILYLTKKLLIYYVILYFKAIFYIIVFLVC